MAIVKEGEDVIFLIPSSYHDNGWRTARATFLSTDEGKDLQFSAVVSELKVVQVSCLLIGLVLLLQCKYILHFIGASSRFNR